VSTAAERLERRNRELGILNSVSTGLNEAADVGTALEKTLKLVAELLGLRSAWVWLLDSEGGPYLAASRHLPPFLREPQRMSGWLCYCLRTFLEGDMDGAANINVLECSRLQEATSGSEGLRYHASIPLYLGTKRVGVMNVAGPDWRSLTEDDLQLLRTIGSQVAIAVERSRLAEESTRLARVEERNRLAREIHDTLAQELAAIALHLETADVLLPGGAKKAQERVRKALQLTREGLHEARRSVEDLRGSALDGRSLPEALGELVSQFARESGIEIYLDMLGASSTLPPDTEAALYRIAQEALTNIRKHAHAQHARVELEASGGRLRMCVLDDGNGFSQDAATDRRGRFGLVGMRERARLLGGDLEVASSEGQGTSVTIEIPIEAPR
jgi:two-component system NarL family sensor kinase